MKNAWKSGLVILPVSSSLTCRKKTSAPESPCFGNLSRGFWTQYVSWDYQLLSSQARLITFETRSRLQRKQKKLKRAIIAASMKCAAQRSDKIKRIQMPLGQSSLHIHKENINPQLRSKCQDCVLGHFWEDRPWIQSSNVFNSGGLSVHDFSAQVPYSWLELSILRNSPRCSQASKQVNTHPPKPGTSHGCSYSAAGTKFSPGSPALGCVGWINQDISGYMGVSENSVPLNPMVNDHYPY